MGEAGLNKDIWETVSGSVLQAQVDSARKVNRANMITIQAMGYVSADENGTVNCNTPCTGGSHLASKDA